MEIWARYLEQLRHGTVLLALGALFACGSVLLWERADKARPALTRIALSAILLAGLALVWWHLSLFDDAYISLRYARNLLEGRGLIWNEGERVEGYTNFLWTMLIAAGAFVTRLELPLIALLASLVAYVALVLVVYRLERALAGDGMWPLGTALVAIQESVVVAGSSGLETGFATALVCAGALCLIRAQRPRDYAASGLCLILATLARPDHAIFYAAAGAVVLGVHAQQLRRRELEWQKALVAVLAFAAPFTLYVAHAAWRFSYYGALLPNTYYAKSADLTYFSQGAIYAATFYLASHFWLLILPLLGWLAWPARSAATARFKPFVALGLAVYNFYVLKVGGDFMFGRFYVVVVPLVLVSLAQAARELRQAEAVRARQLGLALTALVGASACGVSVLPRHTVQWGIADEHTYYRVVGLHPIAIEHTNYRVAKLLEQWRAAGLELRVGTSAIGMIGYYSGDEIIDLVGLTDATVAHQTIKKRGRPGHEKRAAPSYVATRNPHLMLKNYQPKRFEELTRFFFGRAVSRKPWYIYHYDRAAMERIAELTPAVRFKRFDAYLRDYMAHMTGRSRSDLEEDAAFFKVYYFDHNHDPELAARWRAALDDARASSAR